MVNWKKAKMRRETRTSKTCCVCAAYGAVPEKIYMLSAYFMNRACMWTLQVIRPMPRLWRCDVRASKQPRQICRKIIAAKRKWKKNNGKYLPFVMLLLAVVVVPLLLLPALPALPLLPLYPELSEFSLLIQFPAMLYGSSSSGIGKRGRLLTFTGRCTANTMN